MLHGVEASVEERQGEEGERGAAGRGGGYHGRGTSLKRLTMHNPGGPGVIYIGTVYK